MKTQRKEQCGPKEVRSHGEEEGKKYVSSRTFVESEELSTSVRIGKLTGSPEPWEDEVSRTKKEAHWPKLENSSKYF